MKLQKTDIKKKPALQYDVLVVPSRGGVRKFRLTGRIIHSFTGICVLVATMFVVGAASLVYYRHAYMATEDVRVEAASFVREKSTLLGRLAELESSLMRTERFAAKIESAVDKKKGELAGKGPVDEEDWLPVKPWNSENASPNLNGSTWKSPFSKKSSEEISLNIGTLTDRTNNLEERVHSVFARQQDKLFFWASLPSIWPSRGWVTSEFGEHRGWRGRGRLHEGVDIASPVGTPINAPGDGVVTFSGYYHGYGQMITVDHGYGISTLYGHCSAMYVKEGQLIKRGSLIARVGNTGSSTGAHLHYEVHVDGIPVNPEMYVMQ